MPCIRHGVSSGVAVINKMPCIRHGVSSGVAVDSQNALHRAWCTFGLYYAEDTFMDWILWIFMDISILLWILLYCIMYKMLSEASFHAVDRVQYDILQKIIMELILHILINANFPVLSYNNNDNKLRIVTVRTSLQHSHILHTYGK